MGCPGQIALPAALTSLQAGAASQASRAGQTRCAQSRMLIINVDLQTIKSCQRKNMLISLALQKLAGNLSDSLTQQPVSSWVQSLLSCVTRVL